MVPVCLQQGPPSSGIGLEWLAVDAGCAGQQAAASFNQRVR